MTNKMLVRIRVWIRAWIKIYIRTQNYYPKIEAGSQALVVPTELTRSMTICVFCIAKMDKVDNKFSFMQLISN